MKTIYTSRSLSLLMLFVLSSFGVQGATPKRVIVCTYTTGFRHSSIPNGEKAVQEIADTTKAFVIVDWIRAVNVSRPQKPTPPSVLPASANEKQREDFARAKEAYETAIAKWTPALEAEEKAQSVKHDKLVREEFHKLHPDSLVANKIDGVIFVNTSGDLPIPDVEGFVKWIEAGHAFIGMHAASDTLKNSRPYMDMLQGCFAGHGPQVPAKLIAGDIDHPANGRIGAVWSIAQEEIYHIQGQDREKVRALWFMRHDPNNSTKPGYFPLSWARQAGAGKVFYTALGHREDLWSVALQYPRRINPTETAIQFRGHIQGGILWALGLVDGSAVPNPDLK